MIKLFKKLWQDVFYRTDIPFFVNDGYFGRDKCGHFARHVIFTSIGLCLGGAVWCIAFYDTLFDIIYEYKDYCRGNGFSLMDVAYGRAACLITLWIALRWIL